MSSKTHRGDEPLDHWRQPTSLRKLTEQDIWHLRAAFIARLLPDVQDMRVLDAGSGPAHDSLIFAQRGAKVTAFDYSHQGLALARQFYRQLELPLDTVCGDLRCLPFDNDQFDVAFNGGVLEHFTDDDLARVIGEMSRVVKPGGIVLAFCPNRHNVFYQHHLRRIQSHSYDFERAFTAAEMRERFVEAGLEDIHLSGVHVHPAPNYLLPTWLPKYHRIEPLCRRVFAPLEKVRGLDRLKSLIGQDFVIWSVVPSKLTPRQPIGRIRTAPAVRDHGRAA